MPTPKPKTADARIDVRMAAERSKKRSPTRAPTMAPAIAPRSPPRGNRPPSRLCIRAWEGLSVPAPRWLRASVARSSTRDVIPAVFGLNLVRRCPILHSTDTRPVTQPERKRVPHEPPLCLRPAPTTDPKPQRGSRANNNDPEQRPHHSPKPRALLFDRRERCRETPSLNPLRGSAGSPVVADDSCVLQAGVEPSPEGTNGWTGSTAKSSLPAVSQEDECSRRI